VTQGPTGLLVVDKPGGLTSHDVVARVRRLAGTRKVGHAGTLDPMATGVLLLGLGKATRLLGHLALAEKSYDATIRLGLSTTTDDAEGEPFDRADTDHVPEGQVGSRLAAMVGDLDQVPSTVSAVKVAGRRSYERARAGEAVELPPRRVTIHEVIAHAVRREQGFLDVDVSVRCSSGTYVRAIARDLGAGLGVGGHLTRLRRTRIGSPERGVGLAEAGSLETMAERGEVPLLPMGEAARRFFPCVTVSTEESTAVSHGRRLDLAAPDDPAADPLAVLGPEGALLALYRRAGPGSDGTHAPLAVLI
jgi:tRNA pseudouridine55 synthase